MNKHFDLQRLEKTPEKNASGGVCLMMNPVQNHAIHGLVTHTCFEITGETRYISSQLISQRGLPRTSWSRKSIVGRPFVSPKIDSIVSSYPNEYFNLNPGCGEILIYAFGRRNACHGTGFLHDLKGSHELHLRQCHFWWSSLSSRRRHLEVRYARTEGKCFTLFAPLAYDGLHLRRTSLLPFYSSPPNGIFNEILEPN